MTRDEIAAIYLAAGRSRRFGKNKLHQPLGKNGSLGSFALRTALQSSLDLVIVVTNTTDRLNWIPNDWLSTYQGKWVHVACKDAGKGQSYSLKCGLHYAGKFHMKAAMVLLADQPFISTRMINQLIEQHRQNPDLLFVAATFSGITRPPILFTSSIFPKLFQLQGDQGARQLLQHESAKGRFVHFSDPWAFFDVDTTADYQIIKDCTMHM